MFLSDGDATALLRSKSESVFKAPFSNSRKALETDHPAEVKSTFLPGETATPSRPIAPVGFPFSRRQC